jgi:hypothetical protein
MQDKIEIQEQISRYSDALTRRDWAALGATFAPDGSWRVVAEPGYAYSGAEVGPGIRSLVEPANYLVQFNTPALSEVQSDYATARSTILETGEYAAGKFQPFKCRLESFGVYDDELQKISGQWRFKSRRFSFINLTISQVTE